MPAVRVSVECLGEGVYASFDGFHVWVHTDRPSPGYPLPDAPPGRMEVALDPETFAALVAYTIERWRLQWLGAE